MFNGVTKVIVVNALRSLRNVVVAVSPPKNNHARNCLHAKRNVNKFVNVRNTLAIGNVVTDNVHSVIKYAVKIYPVESINVNHSVMMDHVIRAR